MSKLLYAATMSLDGFIAGVDGDMSWLTEHLGTSDHEIDDLDTAVRVAKDAAGGKYVNVLGANVAKQCLEVGLLDEILVLIAPVLLGDGVRLYEHAGGTNVRLEPIDPQRVGPTSLWFRVGRQAANSSSSWAGTTARGAKAGGG